MEACVGRGIDTHRAGRGLGDRDHIHQIVRREPRVLVRDRLEEGKRCQTAADCEQTGLEELPEQL